MKLTGELKDKVDKTESMVEKKDIIAQAGMELTDEELDMVTGGAMIDLNKRDEDKRQKRIEEDRKRDEEERQQRIEESLEKNKINDGCKKRIKKYS